MKQPRDSQGRFVKMIPITALTAAVASLTDGEIDRKPQVAAAWQERFWRLWRMLGVAHYPTTFKANQVGRLGWNVVVDGKQLEPDAAEEALEAVTQPLGTREAARRMALNITSVGETWYARRGDEWNVYGPTTPKLKERLKQSDIKVRVWNPDPEEPDDADSAWRSALDTLDEIRLMAALSRSQDRNRLAQRGILLMPKEAQFPDDDPFNPKLQQAMTTPIGNEYAAGAVVPLVVDMPAELIEKVRHLLLESPYDEGLMDRIDKAVAQLAIQIDMPAELLLGIADVNHWNAWLSEESNYRAHVEPDGVLVGQAFAEAMMQAVPDNVVIEVIPDPSDLLARRQSVADAFEALRLGVVGFEYVRKQIGADDDDAPSDEELLLILALTGNVAAAPSIPALGTGQVETGPPPSPSAAPATNGQAPPPGPVTAGLDDPTNDELDRLSRQLLAIDIQLLGHLKGAAAMTIASVRERVAAEDIGAVDRVAEGVEKLGREWNRQVKAAHRSLRALGLDVEGPEWKQAAEASVEKLVDGIGAFISDNLDRTDSEMPEVPTLLLREVLATAGGSATATTAAVRNPAPTFQDPQGFAIGVLSLKDLRNSNIVLTHWRFRYGPLSRTEPFEPHKEQDGRFANTEGEVNGYSPGDHKGCLCWLDPVLRPSGAVIDIDEDVDA